MVFVCTWCPNFSDGMVVTTIEGVEHSLPICEDCLAIIEKRHEVSHEHGESVAGNWSPSS